MKLTIKTLQQKVFQVDAEGSETVADLKQKISSAQGHSVESQKIIYAGKVLPDSKTIESCEIKEKDFLVLMTSKPKPTPAAVPASSNAAPAAAPAPPAPAPAPAPAAPAPAAPADAAPAPAAAGGVETGGFDNNTSFLSGAALEGAINNLVEMGFERPQVMRAMRASFNNPNRAAEYLMTGIPEGLDAPPAGGAPAGGAPAGGAPAPPAAAAAAPGTGQAAAAPAAPAQAAAPAPAPAGVPQNLFQLAQQQQQQQAAANPLADMLQGGAGGNQVQQMRQLVEQNPQLLQPLVQQLAANNPEMAAAIAQNPEMLFQLLNASMGAGGDGEGDYEEGGEALPPGAIEVELTVEERDAVERLQALGFPQGVALEAYLLCDKNEELAANYLFENGFN